MAEAVVEKFTMVEVHNYNTMQYNIDTFRRNATHMEKQEERLSKLDTPLFNFTKRCRELAEIFLNLQNKCKEWRVVFFSLDSVRYDPDSEEYWAYLERSCSNSVGHIYNLLVFKGQSLVKLYSLWKAWEISDMLNIYVEWMAFRSST